MGIDSKGDFMERTRNDKDVDAALPQDWINAMRDKMGLDYEKVRQWYAWSYKEGSWGKPVHLGEEFISMLHEKKVTVDKIEVSLMDIIATILDNPEDIEIKIK